MVQIVVGAQLPRGVGSEYTAHSPKGSSCLPVEPAECTSRVHAVFAFVGRESQTDERQTLIAAETKAALISVNSCLFLLFRGDKQCVFYALSGVADNRVSIPGTLDLAAYSHAYRVLKRKRILTYCLSKAPASAARKNAVSYSPPFVVCPRQDEVYKFPTLAVCLWGGEGCDSSRTTADCIASATFNVSDPCGNEIVDDLLEDSLILEVSA